MEERWKKIRGFPEYRVSNTGLIRSEKSGRLLSLYENQYGVVCVGLMKDGKQYHRSATLLVANAFLQRRRLPFDTPINLDGNRYNNIVENLEWRPRWFAIKFNQQFKHRYPHSINRPIQDMESREVSENSFECCKRYGLLEEDLVLSIMNRTVVWPTYQEFRVIED